MSWTTHLHLIVHVAVAPLASEFKCTSHVPDHGGAGTEVVKHQIGLPRLSHLSNKGEDPASLVLGGRERQKLEEGHLLCLGNPGLTRKMKP